MLIRCVPDIGECQMQASHAVWGRLGDYVENVVELAVFAIVGGRCRHRRTRYH